MDPVGKAIEELGPWVTRVEHEGKNYGGAYDPSADDRLWFFIERMRDENVGAGQKILECGCLEGGHTVVLAREFPKSGVVATDVREENLKRARLLCSLRGVGNVTFVQDDLEDPKAAFADTYAAVFCVGLLYHLRNPAEFLRKCCAASPRLWLWTVICAEAEAAVVEDGRRGRIYGEPTHHVLSAVREESFFPTLGSLCDMLWDAGYTKVDLIRREMTKNGNGPAILLYAAR